MNRKELLAIICGLSILFMVHNESIGQIQTGVWRTPANNTAYHHFVRNGPGAAVFINQQATSTHPILRLSSGTDTANSNVKFTVENDGRVGIGTVSPLSPLDVRMNGQSGLIGTFLSDQGMPSSGEHRWILRMGRSYEYPNRTVDMGMVSSNFGNNPAFYIAASGNERLRVTHSGNVGIGTTVPTNKLEVNGTIRAKEVKLEATGWPDYVFENGYELMPLDEVESFIAHKGHLPGLKSAREYEEEGVNVMELNQMLLEKVEEVTLYLIQQQKLIEAQSGLIEKQQAELDMLLEKKAHTNQ